VKYKNILKENANPQTSIPVQCLAGAQKGFTNWR